GVGIGDIKVAAAGPDGQAQVDRADVGEITGNGEASDIDFSDVVIGHGVLNDVGPGGGIIGVAGIDDEADLWRGREIGVGGRGLGRGLGERDNGGVVSGQGEGGIDFGAVGVNGQRARVFANQHDIRQWTVGGEVENGHAVFPSGADERFASREDDIRGLVLDVKGVGYDALGDRHDADAVGEFIDDPDLVVVPRINGDWFEADRDFGEQA